MEFFERANVVRLRSHHDKFLVADDDEERVTQDRDGSSRRARWYVEIVDDQNLLRLKSCYGRYLSASNEPFLLGWTGRKVLQTLPHRLDSSLEWEPVRDGALVKLKARYSNFLRANGGMPPWRNSVTHDVPSSMLTQDWVLWDVDVVEIRVDEKLQAPPGTPPPRAVDEEVAHKPPPRVRSGFASPRKLLSKWESSASFGSSPRKMDGRIIYYSIADDEGVVDEGVEAPSISFKGISVEELKNKLQEETGTSDVIICFRNPVDGRLNPLRLHLPPNNTTMHVVIVPASSKVGRSFKR